MIKQIRKDKKLTQKEFSKLTGLSVKRISQIENGKRDFTLKDAMKVNAAFDINIRNLVPIQIIG